MIIRVIAKSLTGEKNTFKSLWKLIYTTIGCFSSIYAFADLLKDLDLTDKPIAWVKSYVFLIITACIVISLILHRERLTFTYKVSGSDFQIEMQIRDFLHINANSYIIPTNTFFRTNMDDEYISLQSIQGRFQKRYFKIH